MIAIKYRRGSGEVNLDKNKGKECIGLITGYKIMPLHTWLLSSRDSDK